MIKKVIITALVFLFVGACVFGVGIIANDSVGAPKPITSDSPCPAVGCASGLCHGFDNVPKPDGIHEMKCPEASCASVECHAWDTLSTRYYQASDASLNLWVLAPVALVIALVLIVRKE
ncbi:MAG: hypothetical protein RR572_06540 [Raoultibacter sp.]